MDFCIVFELCACRFVSHIPLRSPPPSLSLVVQLVATRYLPPLPIPFPGRLFGGEPRRPNPPPKRSASLRRGSGGPRPRRGPYDAPVADTSEVAFFL